MKQTISNEMKAQIAAQMVIMDAIEKGHTNTNELIAYMNSDVFTNACLSYMSLM